MTGLVIFLIFVAIGYILGLYSWSRYDIYRMDLALSKIGPSKKLPLVYGRMWR